MRLKQLKKGLAAFFNTFSRTKLIVAAFVGLVFVVATIYSALDKYRFDYATPAEHLARAKEICSNTYGGSTTSAAVCWGNLDEAARHLEKIPASAPEFAEASKLFVVVKKQQESSKRAIAKAMAEAAQGPKKSATELAWEQAQRNFEGSSHDTYRCSISTTNHIIVSFDNGTSWWLDDGRCAAEQQKKRDAEAQLYSYWSTTLRVDTDMDSFWLPDEERVCQTYPDNKGKVAVVACNPSGSHRDRNIPVTFWGGVERNTVSDWKCRREKSYLSDKFVCRAIN